MPMTNGDVQICYQTTGGKEGIPFLFVQGFSWQLVGWREGFLRQFVDRGAFAITYDNRDVGLSRKFGGETDFDGGYSLHDMATDGLAVLDELGLESVHVVGASMGGMIAQIMAIEHPSRVRSLNLIYTSPSLDERYIFPQESPDLAEFAKRIDRDEAIEKFVEQERISSSPAYPFDEAWIREHAGIVYDRCHAPDGIIRQAIGISRWSPKPEALSALEVPVSIIHGRADRRISVQAALDLAGLMKHSELHIYPGLGHEIPSALWDEFATTIMRTAARA